MSEKLREALQEIQKILPKKEFSWQHIREPHRMLRSIAALTDKALSEAGDEPEMVKLGKGLKELRAKQRLEAEAAHDRQAWVVSHDASTRAGVYSLVIELIEEFGYKPEGEE